MHRKRGVAVIMAMWLLAVLAIFGATFAYMMRLEPIIARYHRDEMKAMYIAQAGIDMAVYKLRRDTDLTIDSFKEEWATYFSGSAVDNDGDGTADSKWITLTDEKTPPNTFGYYAVLINDEGGKVSLNNPLTDNSPWKNLLDGLSMSAATAQKVIDYQAGTYGPFETLDELACVYGISEGGYSVYFRKAKVHHRGFPTNPSVRLPINVNTASEEALRAAFGELTASTYAILAANNLNINRVVQAILDYREGADGIERTSDDNPFDGVDSNVGDQQGNPTSFKVTTGTYEEKDFEAISTDLDPSGANFGSARNEFNTLINYIYAFGYPSGSAKITKAYVRDNIKDNFDPDTEYDNWDSNNPTTPDVNDDDATKEILAADVTYTTNFSFNNSPTGPPMAGNDQFFEIISTGRYITPSGRETLKRIRVIVNRGRATPAIEGKISYYREIPED